MFRGDRRHMPPSSGDAPLPGAAAPPPLSIVVPTFNERENVGPLAAALAAALPGGGWELIVVDDDSPDGTADAVLRLAERDRRVRCLRRLGRRGLATACIEGALASASPYVAVMDADGQHDERLLPAMLEALQADRSLDLVIGSRYVPGGSAQGWSADRAQASRFAGWLGRKVLRISVADPMSGFFMVRRAAFERAAPHLSGVGFKLLLDLLASAPEPLRVRELPYAFRPRSHGESKLDSRVAGDYLALLWDKAVGAWLPLRFVTFALVGGFGLAVHLVALRLGLTSLGLAFGAAQALATLVAMVSNFLLNNLLTYRDRRLRGLGLLRGLLLFCLVCSLGAVGNVGVAGLVFAAGQRPGWWLAGLSGALVSVGWNYFATAFLVWNGAARRARRRRPAAGEPEAGRPGATRPSTQPS
ncbi:MAG: glycosyltransferase family 2 protein [Dongiaceae bacterium]